MKESSGPHFFVVLAGGVEDRLWPLSRAKRLVSQTVARLPNNSQGNVFVACSHTHAEEICKAIREVLPEFPCENVIGEPVPKGTAVAICLVAAIAAERRPDALLTALPADAHIEGDDEKAFLSALVKAREQASNGRIATIGVEARCIDVDSGLGYIERGDLVSGNAYTARGYMHTPNPGSGQQSNQTYLVDTGIHTFPVDLVMGKLLGLGEKLFREIQSLAKAHGSLDFADQMNTCFPGLSIDTNEARQALNDRVVVQGTFAWSDVGSFAT